MVMAASQAVKIGMNRDVSASVLKNVAELVADSSRNPKYQGHTYEILTQLVLMKTACNSEETNAALQSTVRVTLKDLECEALVLPALGYLGALIQVISLPSDEQVKVIETLTSKLKVVKEKSESRKLMWSLANIPLKTSIPLPSLEEMLQVALLFLAENPPVSSLSTVCESLNTLINIGSHQKEFFETNLAKIFPVAFPWLFYDTDRIRELALLCLEEFSSSIASNKLINSSIQAALKSTYYVFLKKLVSMDSVECLKIWGFIVKCFGTDLHESVSLLNELLKIEESALKSKNAAFRQVALEHWRYLIDCFALNPVVLNNSKRIKLMLVPLKSTDTKTIQISKTKIELWWYVLNKLGPDAVTRFQEVVLPLLTFCYGSKDSKGQALIFKEIFPLASTVLAGVLSNETTFHSDTAGVTLSRSFPFLDQKDFDSSIDQFLFFCELLLDSEKIDELVSLKIYSSIWQSFMERCTSQRHLDSLKSLVEKILALVTAKASLMEIVFDSVAGAFSNDQLIQVLTDNLNYLFKWYVENEPLPTHPLSKFLAQLFNKAVVWDLTKFSAEICKSIVSNDATDCLSTIADLWSKYAAALVNNSSNIQMKMIDLQFILFPLSWNLETTDLVPVWPSLVSCRAKVDSSVIHKILNPKELKEAVDVELSIIRFVLKAIGSDPMIESTQVSAWVQQWTKSWLERVASPSDREKCRNLLVDLILSIHLDVANKPASELLLSELRSCLKSPIREVTDILRSIFGPTTAATKAGNTVKLRQYADVCKGFAALLPSATRNTRGRTKTNDDDDGFVVVPPKEKANQVLTEHQKEVRRSRKRSSNVPALYSDLSQSSQLTESQLPESQPSDSAPPTQPLTVVSCSSSIDADEDAMMEPPIIINAEPEPAPPSVQTDETTTTDAEEQETQKESRLRTRKSVPVQRVTRRSTGQLPIENSKESSTENDDPKSPPVVGYQRPCPASKKPKIGPLSRTRRSTGTAVPVVTQEEIVESTANISDPLALTTRDYADKENGCGNGLPAAPALLAILASNAISPRRVTLQPVIEKQTEPVVVTPEIPIVKIPDHLTPAEKSIHELETPASSPTTSSSQPDVEPMETLPPSIEPAKDKEGGESYTANEEIASEPCSSGPVNNSVDDDEAQQQNSEKSDAPQDSETKTERLLIKPAPFSYSNRLKTFPASRVKNQALVRSRPGPACTGGRAAQILELSRKKVKKDDASPRQETEDKTIDIGHVVMTPEGSPARTRQWVPRTYSPFASPSTAGILKKRPRGADEETEEASGDGSPVSSACKSRRVSFADPAVSHLAKISPMPVRLSTGRTRRSLIATYEKPSGSSEAEAQDSNSVQDPTASFNPITTSDVITIGSATSTTSAIEEEQSINNNGEDGQIAKNDCTLLYSEKVNCTDAISVIIDQLAIPGGSVVEVFQERGITSIGNLCAMQEVQIRKLDIQAIHFPSVKEALISYFSSSSAVIATAEPEQNINPTVIENAPNDSIPVDTIPSASTGSVEDSGNSSQPAPIDDQDTGMTESSEPPTTDLREAFLLLSADELLSLIERHSAKGEVIAKLAKRYVKVTVMDTVI